jgi:GTP-binding protein
MCPSPPPTPTGPSRCSSPPWTTRPTWGGSGSGGSSGARCAWAIRVALLPFGEPGPVPEGKAKRSRVTKLYTFKGLDRVEVPEASAGDIVALSGLEEVDIGQTLTHPEHRDRLRGIKVEEPTLAVDFTVNNSPFAGQSGKFVTTRQVRERLFRSSSGTWPSGWRTPSSPTPSRWPVGASCTSRSSWRPCAARGTSSRSRARGSSRRRATDGSRLEPYEEVLIDVPDAMVGTVMEKLVPGGASSSTCVPTGTAPPACASASRRGGSSGTVPSS